MRLLKISILLYALGFILMISCFMINPSGIIETLTFILLTAMFGITIPLVIKSKIHNDLKFTMLMISLSFTSFSISGLLLKYNELLWSFSVIFLNIALISSIIMGVKMYLKKKD